MDFCSQPVRKSRAAMIAMMRPAANLLTSGHPLKDCFTIYKRLQNLHIA